MKYLEPDWKRPPLERKILAIIERLETEDTWPTYVAIRRGIPASFLPHTRCGKHAILDALRALVAAEMLVAEGDIWTSSTRWKYWRSIYRGESVTREGDGSEPENK